MGSCEDAETAPSLTLLLTDSEHLFHSGSSSVSMRNVYLVSRVSSRNWYQLSCSQAKSGLAQKEGDLEKNIKEIKLWGR